MEAGEELKFDENNRIHLKNRRYDNNLKVVAKNDKKVASVCLNRSLLFNPIKYQLNYTLSKKIIVI